MTRKVTGSITIEKTGTVTHVSGYVTLRREIHGKAGAESITLVVVEKKQIRRRRKIRQSAGDSTLTLRPLMRVGEVKLGMPKQLRRSRGNFESANPGPLNRQGKEDVDIAQRIMIEEVLYGGAKIARVKVPSFKRNTGAELKFLISLASQWNEIEPLRQSKSKQRPGKRG